MSGSAVRETLGFVGVIASLVFVGLEIRQNTLQAQAAAYQEVGIATAQWFTDFPERWRGVMIDALYRPDGIREWSAEDWHVYGQIILSSQRLLETLELQVELGLLPAEAIGRLGYETNWAEEWQDQAFRCAWPVLISANTSSELRSRIEAARPADVPACPVDVRALMAGAAP